MLLVKPLKEENGDPSGREPRRRYAALFTWCTHSDTNSSFSAMNVYYALKLQFNLVMKLNDNHSKLINYTVDHTLTLDKNTTLHRSRTLICSVSYHFLESTSLCLGAQYYNKTNKAVNIYNFSRFNVKHKLIKF